MWIQRDISTFIENSSGIGIQILIGPRQCGKSSLLSNHAQKSDKKFQEIDFDDLQMRNFAQSDPALFLSQNPPPLILDEVQYVPNLFPQLKREIDQRKKLRLKSFDSDSDSDSKDEENKNFVFYRLTGSNIILLSQNVSETLVGRAQYFYLNTLSVHEIVKSFSTISISEILFKGGWPELYVNSKLQINYYLNDYISNYIQKDIARSAKIEKIHEFEKLLRLSAARVSNLLNATELGNECGIKSVTVKDWLGILEKSQIVYLLRPYFSNFNKRLTKSPKLYFWDSGLVANLQGWREQIPMQNSPVIGALFENLVLGEILKFKSNRGKNWPLYFWRTKEGEEIDFLLEVENNKWIAFDAKWSLSAKAVELPKNFVKEFPGIKEIVLVVPDGVERKLSDSCRQISLKDLFDFLDQV